MNAILRRFSRRTSSGQFIAEIDGLRFIAITWVVLFHLHGYVLTKLSLSPSDDILNPLLRVGNFGVPLFFVISGFILSLPFASHRLNNTQRPVLRDYFIRRLTRLEPPYILAMTILIPLAMIALRLSFSAVLPHYLSSLVYLHWLTFPTQHNILTVVQWSLEVEIQFYILAPYLALTIFHIARVWLRRGILITIVLIFSALQTFGILNPLGENVRLTLLWFAQYFMIGFLLTDIYLVNWKNETTHQGRWDVINLIAWVIMLGVLQVSELWIVHFILPFLCLVIVFTVFRGKLINRIFTNSYITTIGGMCYTIYLLHSPLISGIGRLTIHLRWSDSVFINLATQFLLIIPPVLLICSIYFLLIERPTMDKHWIVKLRAALSQLLNARAREKQVANSPIGK